MSGTTHSFGDGHDHGPCPTCGHHWKPSTDGSAPYRLVPEQKPCPTCNGTGTAAAPAVEGLVWCHTYGGAYITSGKHAHQMEKCGPHRQLLLGPEVDA